MFTAAYVVLVLAHALAPSDDPIALVGPAPRLRNAAALVLALCSLLLGLLPWTPYLPVPNTSTSGLIETGMLSKTFFTVLGGVVLAILLTPSSQQLGCRRVGSSPPKHSIHSDAFAVHLTVLSSGATAFSANGRRQASAFSR
ncbi:hypothetical protein [Bradyrhizobium sp. 149]|uniref:hypothetical protein n=1 Tax=Bradyrhizobium sp. 149 TaxID=2782624 RepID=UPI001FFA89F0|nr:hypothetical protein [Bradyrhizobium sp. 149]